MGNNAEAKYRVTATNNASKIFDKVRSSAGAMDKSFAAAASSAKVFGIAIAAIGGGAIVKSLSATEKLRGSLKTATESIQGASAAFKDLEKFASTTPFALEQSIEAFVQLKNLGLDPSMVALQSYGNTASAMGKDLSQFIEAVADASTNEFERLKEFGIKAKQQGDQVAFTFQGQTTIVRKSAVQIEGYLQGIGNNKFGEAMSDQMKLLPGSISNASDAFSRLTRTIGDTGLTESIASAFTTAGDWLNRLSDVVASSSFISELQADIQLFKESYGPIFNSIVDGAKRAISGVIAQYNRFAVYITGGEYSSYFEYIKDLFLTLPINAEIAWTAILGYFEQGVAGLKKYADIIKVNLSYGFELAWLEIQEIWVKVKQFITEPTDWKAIGRAITGYLTAGFEAAGNKISEVWHKIKLGFAKVLDFVSAGLSKISDSIKATDFAGALEAAGATFKQYNDAIFDTKDYAGQLKSIQDEQLRLAKDTNIELSTANAEYSAQVVYIDASVDALRKQRDEILAGRDAKIESIKATLDLKAANDAAYAANNPSGVTSPDLPSGSNVIPIAPQFDTSGLQAQIQAISESLQSPVEAINDKFENQLFAVEESFQALVIGKQEHDSLIEGLEEQHQSKLSELRKAGLTDLEKFQALSKKRQVSTLLGQMTEMTAGVAQGNRAMFEINKGAAIAEGVLNLRESITSAYKYGSAAGGPVVGAAYAALAGAAQLANLQAIRSTSFGGRGGGSAPSQGGDVTTTVSEKSSSGDIQPSGQSSGQGNITVIIPGGGDLDQDRQDRLREDLKNLIDVGALKVDGDVEHMALEIVA